MEKTNALSLNNFFYILIALVTGVLVAACANMATPNGGPYDELPPRFLSSTPPMHATNYQGKSVNIIFDELVQIDRPSENVIITPPQKSMPIVRALGKRISVELKDTLITDVTYTLDFTNSISDNNEKNVLENFSFAFSTGNVIDSFEISGIVLNADNLEPATNVMVGLHKNLHDSAFITTPFLRTSKTNEHGRFIIRNIAEGSYKIFALNDTNRDYLFDQPGEEIAFLDSVLIPTSIPATRQDTLWKDSTTIDTIKTVAYTRFLPDDVVLQLFKEKFQRQYLTRPERTQQKMFTVKFNAPVDSLPDVRILNDIDTPDKWHVTQIVDNQSTLNYWITDSTVWKQDTLHIEVNYLKSDSLNVFQPQTDTFHLTMRKVPVRKVKKPKKGEVVEPVIVRSKINIHTPTDLLDTLTISLDEPVNHLSANDFILELQRDTNWITADFTFVHDSLDILKCYLIRPWNHQESYKLSIDSLCFMNVYGVWNDATQATFKFKSRDEYGHLGINIDGIGNQNAFVELLNASDQPVRKEKVIDGGVLFLNLPPATYYARIILDQNQNGKWDTGKYQDRVQPETVMYWQKAVQIKANFEFEETWNVTEFTVDKQKPMEITKNKPKEQTKQKRDYKTDGQQNTNKSGGFGF